MAKRSNFFMDSESWFNRGLSRLFDILLLGIVTTALCIPVITIGAAITANMDIMLRIALKKEDKIMKGYFQAFGKNFLKATLIWLVYLVIGVLVGGAAAITLGGFLSMDSTIRVIMSILSIIMVILYGISICYVFALQARYENKIFTTMLNSILIAISNFPQSALMLGMTAGLAVLGYFFVGLIPLFVVIEFSLVTYISGKLIVPILGKLGDKEAAGEEITEEEVPEEEIQMPEETKSKGKKKNK